MPTPTAVQPISSSGHNPPGSYALAFLDQRAETPTAATFRFSTRGSNFRYRSNLAVRMTLPESGDPRPWRLFSLSSSPTETEAIAVTVKLTGSPFKEALRALRPGDRVSVFGPVGDLLYDPHRPALFLAGGIGITPFRGMMRYAFDTHAPSPIVLLYSARTPEELAFRSELDAMAQSRPDWRIEYTVTRPDTSSVRWAGRTGRIDERWVRDTLNGLTRPKVYVVGVPTMVDDTLRALKDRLGVSEDDLEYEFFRGY